MYVAVFITITFVFNVIILPEAFLFKKCPDVSNYFMIN